jgi:hypothetical protein
MIIKAKLERVTVGFNHTCFVASISGAKIVVKQPSIKQTNANEIFIVCIIPFLR